MYKAFHAAASRGVGQNGSIDFLSLLDFHKGQCMPRNARASGFWVGRFRFLDLRAQGFWWQDPATSSDVRSIPPRQGVGNQGASDNALGFGLWILDSALGFGRQFVMTGLGRGFLSGKNT